MGKKGKSKSILKKTNFCKMEMLQLNVGIINKKHKFFRSRNAFIELSKRNYYKTLDDLPAGDILDYLYNIVTMILDVHLSYQLNNT
jgi:hypothetical protein